MKIVGKKVLLRTAEEQDYEMLQSLIQDPEIVKVTRGYESPCAQQMNWLRRLPEPAGSLRSIIAKREDAKTGLGIIMLSHMDAKSKAAEIYIKLIKSARGRGYGQDAVNTLVCYAFHELRLEYLYSNVMEENIASRRLFETCGFRQEDTHLSRADREGHSRVVCSYGIRKNEVKMVKSG